MTLALRNAGSSISADRFYLQNRLFRDTLVVVVLTSVVQKPLTLMEPRDRYLTLDQHPVTAIWHLVWVSDTEHGVSLIALAVRPSPAFNA